MAARRQNPSTSGRPQVDRTTRRILRRVAQGDAPDVLAAARAAAREQAAAILEETLVEELLSAVGRDRPAVPDAQTAVTATAPPAVSERETGSAWWAYCVVAAEQASELVVGLRGVEPGSPVEAVREGDLAVLVSEVPVSEYGDEQLRGHLEDIAWLERTARAHEAVQEAVLSHEALVPLRLCTIYRDAERVREALRQNSEVFSRNLTALAGAKEWGVKVFLDPSRAVPDSPDGSRQTESSSRGQSGTAYLAGRQREREHAAQTDELAEQCVEEVRRAVGALSIGERVNPVQPPEAHGRNAEMIYNGANLVADGRAAELRAAVSALQSSWEGRGLLVELTGPWPPYNFVSESAGMFP